MKRKSRNKYSEDDLLNAISEVKNGVSMVTDMPRINIKFLYRLCDKIILRVPLTAKAGRKFKFYKRDI